jgi:hypothetical protein
LTHPSFFYNVTDYKMLHHISQRVSKFLSSGNQLADQERVPGDLAPLDPNGGIEMQELPNEGRRLALARLKASLNPPPTEDVKTEFTVADFLLGKCTLPPLGAAPCMVTT